MNYTNEMKAVENFELSYGENYFESHEQLDKLVEAAEKASDVVYIPNTDFSDWHKDIFGFRNRNYPIWMTRAEYDAEVEYLNEQSEIANKREQEREKRAIFKFEDKLDDLIRLGAKTRETAIRWIRDTYNEFDLMYGDEYIEYDWGIPYGYMSGKLKYK